MTGQGENLTLERSPELNDWWDVRDRLTELIASLRIVAPLLDLRVRETGEMGCVRIDESSLSIARSANTVLIEFSPPPWCSPSEARRLTAVAAASVSPVPGWHLIDEGDDEAIRAVLPAGSEIRQRQ
jgi:hypothetical protein